MTQENFNPEIFTLTKNDVLFFVNEVLKYWRRTPESFQTNIKLIGGTELLKSGVEFMEDEPFQTIWNLLIQLIRVLEYQNAIAVALKDGQAWAKTMQNIKSEVKDLGLEKFFQKYLSADLQKKVI